MNQTNMFEAEPPVNLQSIKKRITLRPFQQEADAEIRKGWTGNRLGNTFRRQLLVLATGLGKTIQFAKIAEWVTQELNGRVLVLAHREELLEQAEEKMRAVFSTDIKIGREQAQNRASVTQDRIVTASVATLGRSVTDPSKRVYKNGVWTVPPGPNDRLSRFPQDHFKLIVIDEAHHATADTYQNVLKRFPDAWVLGVTATPKRSDKESLHAVFDRVAYKMDIVDGTKSGWLTPIVSHRVSSKTNLDGIKTTAGDYNLKALAERVNNEERNNLVVQTYLDNCKGQQAIVYATDLDHARALDADFQRAGVSAYAITGEMDKTERKAAIQMFLDGKIQVLTNFGVLTEGFDHKPLAYIINARPTKSPLLLTQIAGRLTRLVDDLPEMSAKLKPEAHFYEIIDNHSEETATAAQIFGFKQTFDCQSVNFLKAIITAEGMEKEKDYFDPWKWKSVKEMHDRFSKASLSDPSGSGKVWDGATSEYDAGSFDSRYRYYKTAGDNYKFIHTERVIGQPGLAGVKYTVRIDIDGMGGYISSLTRISGESRRLYEFKERTLLLAAQRMESCIQQNFSGWDRLLDLNAAWRKRAATEPISDKQYALMSKFRLLRGRQRSQITKEQAMKEISKFFNK